MRVPEKKCKSCLKREREREKVTKNGSGASGASDINRIFLLAQDFLLLMIFLFSPAQMEF